jgi:hypothetical protein
MLTPLTLREFYGETLKAAGFTPPEESTAKFAEASKIDVEIVKMAQSVFEQLQLDGVKYDTPKLMADDAMKIANAYFDHCKTAAAEAEKLAGDLHRVACHAVEGYLSQHGIELDANEGVKIAGLQAQSFQQLTQKQAELRQLETQAKEVTKEVTKTAQDGDPLSDIANAMPGKSKKDIEMERGKIATFRAHDNLAGAQGQFNPDQTYANIANGFDQPMDVEAVKRHIQSTPGVHENLGGYADALHATKAQMPGANFAQVHDAVMKNSNAGASAAAPAAGAASAAKPLLQRPGVMLGAGALGLGAAMLLHRKRQEAQAAQNRQNAIAGAANLPPAA